MIYSAVTDHRDHEMRDDVTHSASARRTGAPNLTEYEFPGRDGELIRVRGVLLGFTTSERETHGHDEYHQDDADVAATLAWVTRRREVIDELRSSRQLTAAECSQATRTLDIYENLLRRADLPATRKPWYQIEPGRCSHCRWFEARILRVDAELVTEDPDAGEPSYRVEEPSGRYLVLTYGRTRVPGETDKRRAAWTNSTFEVIELLVQRDRNERPFLPGASARVLAQASEWDEDIRAAFVSSSASR